MANILIIDDDHLMCQSLSLVSSRRGHNATCIHTLAGGMELVTRSDFGGEETEKIDGTLRFNSTLKNPYEEGQMQGARDGPLREYQVGRRVVRVPRSAADALRSSFSKGEGKILAARIVGREERHDSGKSFEKGTIIASGWGQCPYGL